MSTLLPMTTPARCAGADKVDNIIRGRRQDRLHTHALEGLAMACGLTQPLSKVWRTPTTIKNTICLWYDGGSPDAGTGLRPDLPRQRGGRGTSRTITDYPAGKAS